MKKITTHRIILDNADETETLLKTINLLDNINFAMDRDTELDPELEDYLNYISNTIKDILNN